MEPSGNKATALGLPAQRSRGSFTTIICHDAAAIVQPDSALRAPATASARLPVSLGTQAHPNQKAPALQPDGMQWDVLSGVLPRLLQSAMDPLAQEMFLVCVAALQVPLQLPQS